MNTKLINTAISTLVVCGLTFSAVPASAASSPQLTPATSTGSTQGEVTDAEVDQLAQDLEALFTHGLVENPDGSFTVDEQSILTHFGDTQGKEIIAQFRQQLPTSPSGISTNKSYGECVLNFTGFGAIFGATEGTILGYINRKEWNKAAQTMVKFLGKQAVKGGVVGLAASLAAGGAWCATPWSR